MKKYILKTASIVAISMLALGCDKQVSYKADIAPILESNCLRCHDGTGVGSKKSGFNVTDYDSLMKGTKFGSVIVPGNSISSTLYRLIGQKTDPSIQMPHKETTKPKATSLTKKQIETIKLWIDQGAKNN